MLEECCASDGQVMILACSGGSNAGQLSNQAAVELTREGMGALYCLAGIGGRLSGFVQSVRDVGRLVVVDGCEIGCARATLAQAGVPLRGYLVITADLGIEKNKDLNLKREEIEKVKEAVKQAAGCGGPLPGGQGGCGGGRGI